jgi:hypothetical protein
MLSRTKTKRPQTNRHVLRSAKRYIVQSTSCKADLDAWIKEYNEARPHQARWSPDADLPECNADDEGENDRSLTATDTKT